MNPVKFSSNKVSFLFQWLSRAMLVTLTRGVFVVALSNASATTLQPTKLPRTHGTSYRRRELPTPLDVLELRAPIQCCTTRITF